MQNSIGRIALARLVAPLILAVMLVAGPAVTQAQTPAPIQLSLRQAGGQGGAFSLSMLPGERRELQVQIGNLGSEMVRARTFPSDAYSLVNGGFGARLDGMPTSGTTTWLSYEAETVDLAPGASVDRTFTVTVPADAQPGEYQTTLVLQNADAAGGERGTAAVNIAIKQIVRQALAISITVPGPLTPGLQIGAVTQRLATNGTTVVVEVKNTGNVRLKPSGEFILNDATGLELSRYPIKMDTVYAGTATTAEMPFDQLLNPGDYTVTASLTDASGVSAAPGPLALNVPVPVVPDSVANTGPGRAALNQAPVAAPAAVPVAPAAGSNIMTMIVLGAVALGLILILGSLVLRQRRQPKVVPAPVVEQLSVTPHD